jgi:hypothetical protein
MMRGKYLGSVILENNTVLCIRVDLLADLDRPLLEKIASQVKPIMSKRGWKVGILAEVGLALH